MGSLRLRPGVLASTRFHGPSAFGRPETALAAGYRRFIFYSHVHLQNPSFSSDRPSPRRFPCRRKQEFLRRSSSVAGSGAEFSEQYVGAERKKKRRSVAGIDQDELVDPAMLADLDSAFCEFNGVQIHHKVRHYEEEVDQTLQSETRPPLVDINTGKVGLPMVLLHGFGASVFSWERVMKPLAHLVSSKVLAFDRPAFGLTSRSGFSRRNPARQDATSLNPYSMAFSVLATLFFMDMLKSEKVILMGHSAGCLVAVSSYFESPERIAAMILVAPAIVAPFVRRNMSKETGKGLQNEGARSKNDQWNPFIVIWRLLSRLATVITQVALRIIEGVKNMIGLLSRGILTAMLRSTVFIILVRTIIDKLGVMAIRNAWFDPDQVTDHVIHGYTKPLKIKDWEVALLEYTLAMLTNPASQTKPPLTRRLPEIACPVLIVTGDTDRLVPSWNAERLASAIPGSTFEVIKKCGHVPHEEKAEEFLLIVKRFLQRNFGGVEEAAFTSNS